MIFGDTDLNPFYNVFKTYTAHDLIRFAGQSDKAEKADIDLEYADTKLCFSIYNDFDRPFVYLNTPDVMKHITSLPSLIFLPAQEFLSINKGFIAAYNKRELPYDETYYDLALALNAAPLRREQLEEVRSPLMFLKKLIAGENTGREEILRQQDGRFYFHLPEGELESGFVSEGYRKLATLYYLLRNGSLVKDSILFWDEPEANLNPTLITEVVKLLQMLARLGMQIFIATHDYLLSYELSLANEYPSDKADIKFFALHKPDRTAGVTVESAQTLAEIEHNPILEEFAAHYDREADMFYQSDEESG
jgi:hypothetical protein